jgi:cobalamin biosynthesis Mg chelatase CobN
MADYYPLISNAIAALEKKSSEGRSAFYDRAREILADRLWKADPPLSEAIIEQERLALEDAICKVEADATRSEEARSEETRSEKTRSEKPRSEKPRSEETRSEETRSEETRSEETRSISNSLQTQSDYTQDYIGKAMVEASPAEPVAKLQRERRFAFWGFLILAALWIGDLFYKPLTFSDWYDWLRLGGVILFPTMTILSYFIMRKKFSAEEEERAYIISTPIVLVGAVLVTVALYWIFGRLAVTPS